MPVRFTSSLADFTRALPDAIDAGLVAAATIVKDDIVRRFQERASGYTSGAFATGATMNAVQVFEPTSDSGSRSIQVGIEATPGFPYPVAWELGHLNTFTRKYERVETFRPALEENAASCELAFAAAVQSHTEAAT